MAKGKTQFTCTERRIDKGKWRWTVSYLGECLGTGIAKTQSECRVQKDRVKEQWLAEHEGKRTAHDELPLAPSTFKDGRMNRLVEIYDRSRNLPSQYVPEITPDLRPV